MISSLDWSFRISTHSSPPRRATVSPSRSMPRRRPAIAFSTRSPVALPRLLLTYLKSARSITTPADARQPARAPRHRLQQPVAGGVAEAVFDELEVVEIDHHPRDRAPQALAVH